MVGGAKRSSEASTRRCSFSPCTSSTNPKRQRGRHAMADATTSDRARRSPDLLLLARGIAGAVLGAVAGFMAFTLLVKFFGVYAIAVPGLLVGFAAATFSQRRSLTLGVICVALASL